MSEEPKGYYRSLAVFTFDSSLRRFIFTLATTIVVVWFNIGGVKDNPANIKWIISIVLTDITAYAVGLFIGVNTGLAIAAKQVVEMFGKDLLSDDSSEESDKIGGKDDHHEE
jgi:uncharacterized membrane protein (DUF441 family)